MERLLAGVPRRGLAWLAALLAALLAAPWLANDYLLTVLIIILYFAYTGQAWNIMFGFAGQLSLGHAIYVGLGGYTAAALYVHFGIGPWIGLVAAVAVGGGLRRDHRLSGVPVRRRRRLFRHPHHRFRRIRAHRF
jgi:branched-chain amino acid transport system permease protein